LSRREIAVFRFIIASLSDLGPAEEIGRERPASAGIFFVVFVAIVITLNR
jgi:hypothetical protein